MDGISTSKMNLLTLREIVMLMVDGHLPTIVCDKIVYNRIILLSIAKNLLLLLYLPIL